MKHLAYKKPFDILIQNIEKEVNNGYIRKVEKNNLTLFNYTEKATYEKHWNLYTKVCRGLILDIPNKKIVATPFVKFFNWEELGPSKQGELINKTLKKGFMTFEKMDGSMGIIYYYNNKWNLATRGAFDSPQAIWGEKYLLNNIKIESLTKDSTYIVEIIYPGSQVVVPYQYEGLSILGEIDSKGNDLWLGLNQQELLDNYQKFELLGFKTPQLFFYSNINEAFEAAKRKPWTEEGFVLLLSNGERVKIKGDEYLSIHRVLSKATPLAVWELMKNGKLKEAKEKVPEEHKDIFNEYEQIINQKLDSLLISLNQLYEEFKNDTPKQIGLALKWRTIPYRNFVFPLVKDDLLNKWKEIGTPAREKVFSEIRPNGNVFN